MLSTVNWTGGGDGVNWSDPNNWSSAPNLPGSSDDVVINASGPLTINHASGNDSINSISSTNSQVSLDLSGGSLAVSANSTIAGSFTNSGTLHLTSGTLHLTGGVTSTGGVFVVDAGAELPMGGGVSLDAASSVSGAGSVGFNPGSVTVAGRYNVTGETDLEPNSGDTVDFSGNVQNVGTTLFVELASGGQPTPVITFHNTPINVTNLTLPGGVLTTGPIQASSFTWSGGTLQGTGTVTVSNSMTIGGGDETLDGRILNNSGTAAWIGGSGSIHLIDGAVLNNQSTGSFLIENSQQVIDGNGT
ncbi:MAG TPA: hypothetical protein VG056_04310, partial [Pirellulales bacterium]|nr:hypothetical protein [Pirellulales bacterium]